MGGNVGRIPGDAERAAPAAQVCDGAGGEAAAVNAAIHGLQRTIERARFALEHGLTDRALDILNGRK